ncbi:response regulator transcription factor [Mucilaginibacter auburnensis]|uniref:Regulatory LuxR family protein n=1 Tax=Mucilaginibacter auburnensis TaxID=1457233 RepID=A0A2H9VLM5_9SPHI|nr:response regulator transcription factor [Mucilaginibacter auburnensis]PJJ79224.1 regulatory LuxR family protein [Mucilaginibacter auburnensis]
MYLKLFNRHKQSILYGASLALLLVLLKWLEFKLIIIDHSFELYVGAIALFFTTLGIWLALKLTKPKIETLVVEKAIYRSSSTEFTANQTEIDRLNLSTREVEVLTHMAQGLSNQEIAEKLFVSLNTIKTHSSKIFEKMEVKRRTQAVELAQRLGILP